MATHDNTPKSPRFTEIQDYGPEVAPYTGSVAVPKDAEGLQVPGDGYTNRVSQGQESGSWSEKQAAHAAVVPKRRRKWLWVVLGVVFVALVVGLGAGLGVVLQKKNTENQEQSAASVATQAAGAASSTTSAGTTATQDSSASPASSPATSSTAFSSPTAATATPSDSSVTATSVTSSASQSVATSGTTGIAAFSCNASIPDNTFTTTNNPTQFTEECYVDYPVNDEGYGNPSFQVADLKKFTVYSFQECMEQCALYNQQQGGVECHAVSYSARLSPNVEKYGGNCWVKDGRGVPFSSAPDEDYSLIASAYITDNDGVSGS